jgi:hypothetical protein
MRALVVVAIVFASTNAQADFQSEWRDGCPAGSLSVKPDLDYTTDKGPPVYPRTEATRTGAAPDVDSELVPTRFTAVAGYSQFSSSLNAPGQSARPVAGTIIAHLNRRIYESNLGHQLSLGFTGMYSEMAFLPHDVETVAQSGNLVVGASLRGHWLTSGTVVDKSRPSSDDNGPIDAVGLRHAVAAQVLVFGRPWDGGTNAQQNDALFLQRTAFTPYLMSPNGGAGFAFETRSEQVGCYSPFIHVRLAFYGTSDAGKFDLILPETIAVGFSASEHFSLMFQYGLLIFDHTGNDADSHDHRFALLGTNVIHRFRFGGSYDADWGSVAAFIDMFRGADLYKGGVLTLSFSPNVLWSRENTLWQ